MSRSTKVRRRLLPVSPLTPTQEACLWHGWLSGVLEHSFRRAQVFAAMEDCPFNRGDLHRLINALDQAGCVAMSASVVLDEKRVA